MACLTEGIVFCRWAGKIFWLIYFFLSLSDSHFVRSDVNFKEDRKPK